MITIDKVSCLCLDKRWKERHRDLFDFSYRLPTKSGMELFIAGDGNNDLLEYDYIDNPNPDISNWGYGRWGYKHHHWNALQCHKQMILRAQDENRDNLLILEDDAYLTSRFEEIWSEIAEKNDNDDFDLLYLGWWIGDENDQFNTTIEQNWNNHKSFDIAKTTQVGGLHGCLLNKSMFNYILDLPENNPIDYQFNQNNVHEQFRSFVIRPKLIHTRTTLSYCEGSVINRKEL